MAKERALRQEPNDEVGMNKYELISTAYNRVKNCKEEAFPNLGVYPNPVKDVLYLNLGKYSALNEKHSIRVINTQGQLVSEKIFFGQGIALEKDDWGGAGIYLVQVFDESGELVEVERIMLE